jgi:aminopeptidase N
MPAMMRIRSGMSAERTAAWAYPDVAVEPETRRLAAELLARDGLDPILRRVVLDADDDLRRAMAARF